MPNGIYPIPLTGGVNLFDDPRRISDNECVRAYDLVPTRPGILQSRPVVTALTLAGGNIGTIASHAKGGVPFAGIMMPQTNPAFDGAMAVIGSTTPGMRLLPFRFGYTGAGQFEVAANAAAAEFGQGITPQRRPAMFVWAGKLYCFGGYGFPIPGKVIDSQGVPPTGYTFPNPTDFAFAGVGNGDIYPSVAAIYGGRAVYGNLGPGYEDCLLWADSDLGGGPTVVGDNALDATTGRFLRLSTGLSDRVVALVEIMQSDVGNPTQGVLLVLKEHSAYIVSGEPDFSTGGTSTLAFSRISYDCGCISAESVVNTPYGVLWCSRDDVWSFTQGALPTRVGTKIRPAIERLSSSAGWMVHAAYFNGFYRIALPAEGQAPGLISDPPNLEGLKEQYWLDLREGPPQDWRSAAWWGPQRFSFLIDTIDVESTEAPYRVPGTLCMVPDYRSDADPALYTFCNQQCDVADLIGTYNAHSFEASGIRDDQGIFSESYFDGQGCEVVPELWTKDFEFGDPMVDKLYQGAELSLRNSGLGRLSVATHLDSGKQVSTSNVDTPVLGFESAVGVTDATLLTDEIQAVAAYPDVSTRLIGKAVQLRLKANTGYLIDATNDLLVVEIEGSGAGEGGVIPHGLYADLGSLGDAVVAVLNTLGHGAWSHDIDTGVFRNPKVSITSDTADWSVPAAADWATFAAETSAAAGETGTLLAAANSRGRRLWDLFGFAPLATPSEATTQTADAATFLTSVVRWEIGGITVRIRGIPRRPV